MSLILRILFVPSFVLFLIVIFTSSQPILSAKEKMSVPEDFSLFLHSGGVLPGDPEYAITLDPKGHGKYYEKPEGPDTGQKMVLISEFDLDSKAMNKIYETIKKEKFFDLKPEYKDPTVKGGNYAEMDITSDGKRNWVRTINIKVDAFDNIVRAINSYLTKETEILYNALLVDEYKRVER